MAKLIVHPYFTLALTLFLLSIAATEEKHNKTIPGGVVMEQNNPFDFDNDSDKIDGGFSSLHSMLQWAIGHSDPKKLKEKANDVRSLSANELQKRQLELTELMEKLKTPSDADLMKLAISDLNNSSTSVEDRLRALDELSILVEHIDNANDLNKLGGLVDVVHELGNSVSEVRKISAWVLGKAAQNNILVQNQILELGALPLLIKMVGSIHTEEAIKALYVISSLIRSNGHGQESFFLAHGDIMLREVMRSSSVDIRLQKKVTSIVVDLADSQFHNKENKKSTFLSERLFLESVVDLTLSFDLDLQEKALLAVKSLLQITSTNASDFKDYCALDDVLDTVRDRLKTLMADEEHGDYAKEIESIREEVYMIYQRKLRTVRSN